MTTKGFRVGDKVWDIRKGWGIVFNVGNIGFYPVVVNFDGGASCSYTTDGRESIESVNSVLYYEELSIPETATQRPRFRAKVDQDYWYVSSYGAVFQVTEKDADCDMWRHRARNYFQTQKEAEESPLYKAFQIIF